jgi:pre-rRNA-processing protein TSR1
LDVLDAVKLCDFAVFVVSAKEEVDKFGELLLSSILAQGLPQSLCVIQHMNEATQSQKLKIEIRKSLLSYMTYWAPGTEKLFDLGNQGECANAIRYITERNPKSISWREKYPYMIPESAKQQISTSGNSVSILLTLRNMLEF